LFDLYCDVPMLMDVILSYHALKTPLALDGSG